MKINIRESLGRLDLLTDNKYDLRNTYDSSNISNDKKKKLAESLNNNASAKQIYNILNEDTIKQNGKWVNKGSEGTHGKFKTKKAADAQRKAMFANGYKGESLKEDIEDSPKESAFDSDEYEREHILRLAKAVKEASKGADERKLSNLKKTAKKYLTNHKGTKHEKEYAILQKAYDSLLDEDWEPDEWEETDFLDNDGKKVYINIIKEAEDIDDLKDIAHDLYWHDKGLFAMLRNFPKDKSFEEIRDRMIEVIKSTMNESLTEASYGGAYDIEDDMFWTKDDLIEFSDAVCEKLADKFGYQYDIADVGAESNNDMYITIMDTTHDIEADVSFRIKMSRIRSPRDLMKYLDTVVSQFVKKFEEEYQYYDFDESLNEDMSKPDFVVGFYAGPVDDETLELVNPKKISQVDVSADELRAKYGKTVDKLLNDYTSQTVDKLKSTNSWLKVLILNFAEEKARKTGKLDDKFRNEERKFLETGIYMEKRLEEVNYPFEDGIKKLSKQLGKMLLPKRENLKEDMSAVMDDFAYARRNWDRIGTGISLDDALEEYNAKYGQEGFYARPLYSESEWNKMVNMFADVETMTEAVDDEKIDLDVETDFGDGGVEEGDTFIEDGRTWSWIERIAGPIHLDFDNWSVWSARDWDYIEEKVKPLLVNKEEFNVEVLTKIYDEAEVAYFVVDEDTGFIDWGPVESQTEAQDFLNGKVEDWENDEYDESLKESKQLKESYGLELEYDDIDGDGSSYTYEVDEDKVLDYLRDRDDYPEEIGNLPDDEFQAWFKTKEYDEWLEDNLYELFEKHYDDLLDYFEDDAKTEYFDRYGDEYLQDWETGSWYRRRW